MKRLSYFDLQVNGYAGCDFNGERPVSAEGLHECCRRLSADGVGGILATFVTDDVERMAARMARLAELRQADRLARRIIVGFHVEGPFLNRRVGYRGAHPAEHIRRPNLEAMKRLMDAGAGLVRLVTLAPELDRGLRLTRMLADAGVVASAGHCDPTLDELNAAIDAGLSMFTHLGNGCPNRIPRHDNIIQRVLSLRDRLWLTFIADGVHVPLPALGNYLRAAGLARTIVVTDAVSPAGLGPGRYRFRQWPINVGQDLAARRDDGQLLGSAITMRLSERKLVDGLGLSEAAAQELLAKNPRTALGVGL